MRCVSWTMRAAHAEGIGYSCAAANSACRLLLGNAVKGPQPPGEIDCPLADDLSIGQEPCQDPDGHTIGRVVELWHHDHAVGDIEIRVTPRQPLIVKEHGARHRQGNNLEWPTILVDKRFESPHFLAQRSIVFSAGCPRPPRPRCGRDKTGELVDMPIRVIPRDAAVEPQDGGAAQ